jgi:site-specific recombinase XerC
MCYKTEQQRKAADILENKIKDIPEFIQNYFVFLKSNNTKLNNWSAIKNLLEWLISQNIIKSKIEDIKPEDFKNVTDVHIVKYLDGLKDGLWGEPIALTTLNTKKNIYSGFWAYLVDKDYVIKNIITKQVSALYVLEDDNDVTVPTDEEIDMLLNNIEKINNETVIVRNIAIIKLFAGSGIRISELVGLDTSDLHFDNPQEPYITVLGKGKQENKQEVPINKTAYNEVLSYLRVRNANPEWKDMDALFISEKGNRLSVREIQRFFYEYSNGTIHPHMLRHYVGTRLNESSGHDLEMVRKQLRHKNINTTAKIYVKTDKGATYNALNNF